MPIILPVRRASRSRPVGTRRGSRHPDGVDAEFVDIGVFGHPGLLAATRMSQMTKRGGSVQFRAARAIMF
jgi:hypothetical protein